MNRDDLESELRNLKLTHLTESELTAYNDQELGQIGRARAEAHLKQCFICERELALLLEESAALGDRARTPEDVSFVGQLMEQMATEQAQQPSIVRAETFGAAPIREMLNEYLRLMTASLRLALTPVRGPEPVWQWQSEDGRLQASATTERNADMMIQFSSSEIELDGALLRFRLGSFRDETTLRKVSESEVAAQVAVPRQYRQDKKIELSIEVTW